MVPPTPCRPRRFASRTSEPTTSVISSSRAVSASGASSPTRGHRERALLLRARRHATRRRRVRHVTALSPDRRPGFELTVPFTEEPITVCVWLASKEPCYGGASPEEATYLTLPADGSDYTLPAPLVLPAGSLVEGRVVTRGGVPQRDVQVSLFELIDDDSDGTPDYANQTDETGGSDAEGRVRIVSDRPAREVTACAQTYSNHGPQMVCLGGAREPLLADTVTVPPAGDSMTLPDLVLRYAPEYYCQGNEIGNGTISLGVNCEGELNRYDTGLVLDDADDDDSGFLRPRRPDPGVRVRGLGRRRPHLRRHRSCQPQRRHECRSAAGRLLLRRHGSDRCRGDRREAPGHP